VRLSFRLPSGWTERRQGDVVHLVQPGSFASPWIAASPIVAAAGFDVTAAIEQERPSDSSVRYLEYFENLTTADGWPMKLASLEVVARDGAAVEQRLAAVYQILYFTAVAVARGPNAALFAQERPVVVEILGSARPYLWPASPVTIAELWSMEDP
jgi:hypothetical protein